MLGLSEKQPALEGGEEGDGEFVGFNAGRQLPAGLQASELGGDGVGPAGEPGSDAGSTSSYGQSALGAEQPPRLSTSHRPLAATSILEWVSCTLSGICS